MKEQNFEIHEAENGLAATELFRKGIYNLVFMDIQMPLMDGFECTKVMRQIETENHLKHTPIIALTACVLDDELRQTRTAGCDDHTTKPISKKTLLSIIKNAI